MGQTAGRRRVAVLAGGALIQLFCGIPAAWGAFQKGVETGYELDTGAVTLVFSFVIAAFGIGCVAGGLLQDKLGPRPACLVGGVGLGGGFWLGSLMPAGQAGWLYLAFSLPVGLGCAVLYPAVMSCAQKWWPRHRGFATGVIGTAVGLSGAVLTFCARWLCGAWDIRVCFRVLGSVMAAVCVVGALALADPPAQQAGSATTGGKAADKPATDGAAAADKAAVGQANDSRTGRRQTPGPASDSQSCAAHPAKNLPPKQVLRTADYWLLLAAVAASTPTVLLFSPVILQLGQDRGLSENVAALAIVAGSLTSAAGRLAMPWVSDRIGRRSADLILYGALAGFSAVFAFVQQGWVILLYACLTFCYSGAAALLPAFALDRYGSRWAGVNYGLLALGMSAGSLLFPLLARTMQGDAAPHWIAVAAAGAGFICLLCYGRGRAVRA